MDIRVLIILCLEALFALWLLYRAGVLESAASIALCVALLAAAFIVRALCLDYVTLDYTNFLSQWVQYFRDAGGFAGLSQPVGNYNIPYLYFLALFSYSSINDLYLIKLLSIFFDVVLAYASMRLLQKIRPGAKLALACFFTVLFLPTVILNGALWGQCDSTYTALAVLSIYLALDDRPCLSVISMTLAFGFKLQAVFVMPILAVLWMQKRYKPLHFLLFPLSYTLLVLPAVLCGRPFIDTLTLYLGQTGSIGSGLNYNSPSIYSFFYNVQNEALASSLGIAAAFIFMFAVLIICFIKRRTLGSRAVLAAAVLFAVGIPLLLPHMHDRYFFAADILTVVMAYSCFAVAPAPLLCQFASLLGYHAYLRMAYFLPMSRGAIALIIVLVLAFTLLFSSLEKHGEKTFKNAIDKSR